jgi:ABC-type multidrug transport system fused ATPase/permease subunit
MTQQSPSPDEPKPVEDVWPLTKAAFGLLTRRERWIAAGLVALILIAGGLDLIALASVMPVVTVITEPLLLEQNARLTELKDRLGIVGSQQFVMIAAIMAGGLLLVAAGFNLFLLRLGDRFGISIQTRMARELMSSVLNAPYLWHTSQNSVALVRFFHADVVMWGRSFILRLTQISQHILGMLLPLLLLIALAPGGAVGGILAIGMVGILITQAVKPNLIRAGTETKVITRGLVVLANNAVSGIKDVKLACKEEQYADGFSDRFKNYARAQAALGFWPSVQSNSFLLLGQLAILGLAVFFFSTGQSHGQIAGQMALIILVISRVLPSANRFFNLYSSMWNVLPWVQEVVDMHRDLRSVNPGVRSGGSAIITGWDSVRCDRVGFKYPGQTVPALDSVSFKFSRGGLYGVVGESGAGKSTLIDLLVGLHEPTAGKVLVNDQELRDYDMKSWHRQIGYVPQFPYLADGSVAENVALGMPSAEVEEAEVWDALELANLAEFIRGLPEGLNTPVGDRGVRLSGGQRQRLAIARALFQKPQLLVLDEATSSLDQIAESEIRTALEKLHGRITVIMIAHRMTTVQDCDEILFLSKGKLEAQGRYEELLEKHEGFRRLAGADVDHAN